MTDSKLAVAVAEDEPLARERILRLLREANCAIVAEFSEGPSLAAWLQTRPVVDALFLDVHMPGASAFEALAEAGPGFPPLVFVSAYPEHALRAFEVRAVDFLLKPVSSERLAETLARLRRGEPPRLPTAKGPADRFPAKAGDGHVVLDLRRVSHFELTQEVVWAWAKGCRFRTTWRSLAEVESAFPDAGLLRIQRNILLRPEAVLALRPLFGGRASVRIGDGQDLEVSRAATPPVKARMGLK